jgi:thiamine monophosphate kinase
MGGRDYLVRQLNDHKSSVELEDLVKDGLAAFAQVCGELLARSHARAGDPLVISGYLGNGANFAEALADFGSAYADQTEKDWQDLRRALHHPGTKSPSRPAPARKNSSRKK